MVEELPETLRPVMKAVQLGMSDGYGLRGVTVGMVKARMAGRGAGGMSWDAVRAMDVRAALDDLVRCRAIELAPSDRRGHGVARRYRVPA
jgi:hypothetical protein